MVGLGKMGLNMTARLVLGGHRVVAYDINAASVEAAVAEGAEGATLLRRPRGPARRPARGVGDGPGGRPHQRRRDGRGRPARARRHDHRRGQLALHRFRRARRNAQGRRAALCGHRHERGHLGPQGRLLHDDRRARGGRRTPAAPLRGACARARPGLGARGAHRRRALRQDGPQRHRVRHDAGLRRGLPHPGGQDAVCLRRGQRGRDLAHRLGHPLVAARPRRQGPRPQPLARRHRAHRGRLRRGPLDRRRGDRPQRARARHHGGALGAHPLARGQLLHRPDARRAPLRVRRPLRTSSSTRPRFRPTPSKVATPSPKHDPS